MPVYEQIELSVINYPSEISLTIYSYPDEISLNVKNFPKILSAKIKDYPDEIAQTMPLLSHPHTISVKLPDIYEYFVTTTDDIFETFDGENLMVKI